MHFADGNLEGLILAGILLLLHSYQYRKPFFLATGILLAVIKPQDVSLLAVLLILYLIQTWPRRAWLKTAVGVAALALLPMLSLGGNWIDALFVEQHGLNLRLNNITLLAAFYVLLHRYKQCNPFLLTQYLESLSQCFG